MIKQLALLALFATTVPAQAGLNVFTEHQIISMLSHGVNQGQDVKFKTGDYPYLGQVGLEYKFKKISYSMSYIHRSNVDVSGDEYNYNGIALGVKYSHCIINCK